MFVDEVGAAGSAEGVEDGGGVGVRLFCRRGGGLSVLAGLLSPTSEAGIG